MSSSYTLSADDSYKNLTAASAAMTVKSAGSSISDTFTHSNEFSRDEMLETGQFPLGKWLSDCRRLAVQLGYIQVHLASTTPPKAPAVVAAVQRTLKQNGIEADVWRHMVDCADSAGSAQPIGADGCQQAAAARSRDLQAECLKGVGKDVLCRGADGTAQMIPYVDGLMIVLESGMMHGDEGLADRCYGRIEFAGEIVHEMFGQESLPIDVFDKFGLTGYLDDKYGTKYADCLDTEGSLRIALDGAAVDMEDTSVGGVTLGKWMGWLIHQKYGGAVEFDHKDWMAHCRHGKSRQTLIREQIEAMSD